jgi:phage replication O-like protein O
MQTPLYLKDEESSSKKSFNPSLPPENRLNLLPEHHAQIGAALIQQLALASLKARDVQILAAIYNQTIGFDKREDDMNGRRLEQLTGIRSDHANDAVRRLEDWNVIVTHSGHYGKWMSINFDFVNWGQIAPESQTNEPYILLSACYQPLSNNDEQLTLHAPPLLLFQKKRLLKSTTPELKTQGLES